MFRIPLLFIDSKILNRCIAETSVGLFSGKMGFVIYFYHLSRYMRCSCYAERAEALLEQLVESELSQDSNLTVEDGLCGIVLGLQHLIQHNFVTGDINFLAKEIDEKLFRQILFANSDRTYTLSEMIQWIYYIYRRTECVADPEYRYIYEELNKKLINRVVFDIDASFFTEAHSFSVYSYQVPVLMYSLLHLFAKGFYSHRLTKILEYLSSYLFSHVPHLHLNRLYLLSAILSAKDISSDWSDYIYFLRENIDLEKILRREIDGRNIYIRDGLSCLYLLLENLKSANSDFVFEYDPKQIYDRIISSDAWDELCNKPYYFQIHQGLLNGFPGAVLTLLDIKNKYL